MAPIRRPGGWVVPGYKYLGPFNPLDNGEPVNAADRAAQKHDQKYNEYIKENLNPYLYFNKADSDFIEDLESDKSFGGWIGKTVFGIKRAIAPSLGEPDSKRAKTDRAAKRKLYFARQNRPAKQAKMDSAPQSEQGETSTAQDNTRAGGRVGVSTGGWKGGTLFSDNVIVTRITRQWYCPIYNGHKYSKHRAVTEGQASDSRWCGIATPWGYFDFNNYAGHFNPQDWQRLINEYKRWRPKSMHIKMYNLQIKQVVTLGADTLYNNDLTAGVHVYCDGSHQYPYPQHPWDEGGVPELPNDVWKLPQYGYFQFSNDINSDNTPSSNGVNKAIRTAAPMFMLETSSHEVLRTGEETQFSFTFESGWVNNDRCYVQPQYNFNPLTGTRRWFPTYYQQNNQYKYHRFNPYKKPSNWMPGPGITYRGKTATNNHPDAARGPIITTTLPPFADMGATSGKIEGDIQVVNSNAVETVGTQTAPVNGACSRTDMPTLSFDVGQHNATDTNVTARNYDIDMSRWNAVYGADKDSIAEFKNVWMYPNQAWNSTPICRGNPIWVKAPNLDRHTLRDSSDGSLVMEHPPGTIYVKTQKIPIPTENNADAYLNLYVTGQITCEIVWEAERYATKNWRPENRANAADFELTAYDFDEHGAYNMPTNYLEHMPTRQGMNSVL
nr:structural protein 3 [buhirugu virus 26]